MSVSPLCIEKRIENIPKTTVVAFENRLPPQPLLADVTFGTEQRTGEEEIQWVPQGVPGHVTGRRHASTATVSDAAPFPTRLYERETVD